MTTSSLNYHRLSELIQLWGKDLGFSQVGICDVDLSSHETYFKRWLANQYHGDMEYMARHGLMRTRPDELEPGALRVISVRLDYLPEKAGFAKSLKAKDQAYISRYALGRDYHKLMRKRLRQLGEKISHHCYNFSTDMNFRPFVDSAPVLERPLAEKAGLGWVGKHSLLINHKAGSWFFLGELLVDIPLHITTEQTNIFQEKHDNLCGNCIACIKICPTQAIVKPYVIDARRCISYFTIESAAPIPVDLRSKMGNRIYGCDDCQLICPWNKYASPGSEADFQTRNHLDNISLLELFSWTEDDFLLRFEGSPIRRIGFNSWQRNVAVALGNAPYNSDIINALNLALPTSAELVAEHIQWALEQQELKTDKSIADKDDAKQHRLIKTIEKVLPRDA
ncbi:MAG: tRNA epoxyqueuosine(34) reductase QueG [Gammaproteobacteria bacterium]|nr:tRNA epoxyqueuosine(34) reductase QueG [Gammaproteobacteria bacterium]